MGVSGRGSGSAWTLALWALAALACCCLASLPELECPEECECHYFRINWVTDCSESNLTEIPNDNMSLSVYILNMNGNNVTTWPTFPADMKLRRLQVADNRVQAVTKEMFQGLGYLIDVDVSSNNISTVDPESFKDSPGLLTVELQNNPIGLHEIDGPFLHSQTLLYLDLSDCNLTRLSTLFFSGISALNRLDLSSNPLGELRPAVLDPLSSLEHLKLNRCNLTALSESAFSKQEHLKILELAGNFLTDVDWAGVLQPLVRLETLDLRASRVTYLPEDVFANNIWIRSLILAENELRDLDVATTLGHNLRHLDHLDLSNCHLRGPLSEDAFANATKLRSLLLSGNRLSASDLAVALAPLTKLQRLSLRNCSLHRLPDHTFHRFTDLQELDLSRNPLQDAFTSLLSPLESLERLDMGYSNLGYISRTTFSKMTSLKTLVLSGNPLNTLESGLFQNLTHLETLELNNCGLVRAINPVVFDNATYSDLRELRLAGNPLKVTADSGPLLPSQLCKVRVLDLSNCNLTVLPPDAFNTTQNITRLLLSGNRITSAVAADDGLPFLQHLPAVEMLDLTYNNLSRLSPAVFRKNHQLATLKLVGNPWQCDCSIAEMWEWALNWRGDLGLLAGSTITPEDTVAGGAKRKKNLVCSFHPKISPLSEYSRSWKKGREFTHTVNRTWAKYVRESGCQPSKTLVSSRFARDVGALAMDDDVDVLRMEDVGYASQDEVQDEALVLNTGGAAPKKLQRGARGARDRGESDGAQVGPRAPGASVATLAVVGVVTLVVLAAAAIASIASRTARHKTPVDVVGLVPVVGGSSGSAEALAHVVEGSEKMKHL